MISELEQQINNLNQEDLTKFDEKVLDALYNRRFCRDNGIDYCNPNIPKVKEIIYYQMFGNK